MSPEEYALYAMDEFGEPDHWLKNEERELKLEKKFKIDSKLILKARDTLAPSEILKLQIHLTNTGS